MVGPVKATEKQSEVGLIDEGILVQIGFLASGRNDLPRRGQTPLEDAEIAHIHVAIEIEIGVDNEIVEAEACRVGTAIAAAAAC